MTLRPCNQGRFMATCCRNETCSIILQIYAPGLLMGGGPTTPIIITGGGTLGGDSLTATLSGGRPGKGLALKSD